MGIGWSLKVEHHGQTLYYIDHTHDLGLSRRIAEVAEEVVDCSPQYAEAEKRTGYKIWWPHCGYPNRYLVRNDRLRDAIAADPAPEKFLDFSANTIFDVE